MNANHYCVYKHTSPNGKVYIGVTGKTPRRRWGSGKGYENGTHIRRAIDKYGWESFAHEILIDGLSKDSASFFEKYFIEEYKATDPDFGYNMKDGGYEGGAYTEEVRAKISASLKKYYADHPDRVKEISYRMIGKKHSEEARRKMSAEKSGKHITRTKEHNKKIGEGIKRFYETHEESRIEQGNRIAQYGIDKRKPVVQLCDDGSVVCVYESGKAAMRATGISDRNIIRCCQGGTKHASGYKWRYAVDYNSDREIAIQNSQE